MPANKFTIEATIKAVDKITRPVRKLTRNVLRGTAKMVRGFKRVTRATTQTAKAILSTAGNFTKMASVGAAALGTGVVLLNKSTTEAEALSKAVGISVDTLEGLGAAVKPLGFDLENVADLVEEMNNKLGESAGLAQTLPVQESLKLLNLEFAKLKKLKPEKQFETIMNAALKLEDAQKAKSATDILLGAEANKITGLLREQGKTMADVTAKYRELNFQTAQSRRGAAAFTTQFNQLLTVITTVAKFTAGLVGEALAPLIDKMTKWVTLNKELIRTKIATFLQDAGKHAKTLFDAIQKFVESDAFMRKLDMIVDTFRELGEILKGIRVLTDKIGLTDRVPALEGHGVLEDAVNVGSLRDTSRFVSSPQERTAKILEERKVTNTTEVTLKDETGKAEVTKGGTFTGFNMIPSGVF